MTLAAFAFKWAGHSKGVSRPHSQSDWCDSNSQYSGLLLKQFLFIVGGGAVHVWRLTDNSVGLVLSVHHYDPESELGCSWEASALCAGP